MFLSVVVVLCGSTFHAVPCVHIPCKMCAVLCVHIPCVHCCVHIPCSAMLHVLLKAINLSDGCGFREVTFNKRWVWLQGGELNQKMGVVSGR